MEEVIQAESVTYQLQHCLGQGLNSRVFKALRCDGRANIYQTVAIKILNSENLVEIWKKEFHSLSTVRSEHCVRVLSFDWIRNEPALILELIEGVSLMQLWNANVLQTADVLEVIAQVKQGLLDLANVGLCHGDLSLSNIMIDETGRVVLLDFGLANFSEHGIQTTVEFADPLLLAGGKPNLQTDLYALGKIAEKWLGKAVDLQSAKVRASQRRSLGDKIRNFRLQLEARTKTQAFEAISHRSRNSKANFRAAALIGLIAFSLTLKGESNRPPPQAHLTIKTQRWLQIEVNGINMGYAPFEYKTIPSGVIKVRYAHYKGKGEKTFRVQRGEHLLLGESSLMPHSSKP